MNTLDDLLVLKCKLFVSTMDPSDDVFCIYAKFVLTPLMGAAVVSMIYPIYLFAVSSQQKQFKSSIQLFYAAALFFVILIAFYVIMAIYFIFLCIDHEFVSIFYRISFQLYVAQTVMIAAILFARLVTIFKGTILSVSKCTIVGYVMLILTNIIFVTAGNILYYNNNDNFVDIGLLLIGCASLVYILVLLSLNGLFIHKLIRVYKTNKESTSSGKKWLDIITKISILCFLSTWFTLLFLSMSMFRDSTDSPHFYFAMRLSLIFDTYTNFLSLLFSFNYFDGWYRKLCGSCDSKCHLFWNRCVNKGEEIEMRRLTLGTRTSTTCTSNGKSVSIS